MGIPRWARQRQPAGGPLTPATLPCHARLCTSPRPRTSTPHLLVQMHGHRDPARSTACLCKEQQHRRPVKSKVRGKAQEEGGLPEFVFCAGPGKLFLASTSAPCRCDGSVRAASGLCRGTCGARAAFTRVLLSVPRVWQRPDPGLDSWSGDAGSRLEQRTWRGDAAPVGCHAAGSGSKPAVRRTRRG